MTAPVPPYRVGSKPEPGEYVPVYDRRIPPTLYGTVLEPIAYVGTVELAERIVALLNADQPHTLPRGWPLWPVGGPVR